MSKVDELKTEIERLPREEFTELVRWLSEDGVDFIWVLIGPHDEYERLIKQQH